MQPEGLSPTFSTSYNAVPVFWGVLPVRTKSYNQSVSRCMWNNCATNRCTDIRRKFDGGKFQPPILVTTHHLYMCREYIQAIMHVSQPFISVKLAKGLSRVKVFRRNVAVKTHFAVKISVFVLCVNITVFEVVVKQKWVKATELLPMLTQSACCVLYSW